MWSSTCDGSNFTRLHDSFTFDPSNSSKFSNNRSIWIFILNNAGRKFLLIKIVYINSYDDVISRGGGGGFGSDDDVMIRGEGVSKNPVLVMT